MSASALPSFLVLMGVGIAALIGLILRERRAATPLLPIHLLRQPTIWRSDALAACHGATLVSLITFIAHLPARAARHLGVRDRACSCCR